MLTDEVFIRKILAAVKEPEMIQPWNKSFTINATVFYVPEPYTPEMLLETCTQIRFFDSSESLEYLLFSGGVPQWLNGAAFLCSAGTFPGDDTRNIPAGPCPGQTAHNRNGRFTYKSVLL
jgi:hypothetical protein